MPTDLRIVIDDVSKFLRIGDSPWDDRIGVDFTVRERFLELVGRDFGFDGNLVGSHIERWTL